jgi:type VI secretion system protein ImpK
LTILRAMRAEIANLVYPVIRHALGLKDRLQAGEEPGLDAEQAIFRSLLLADKDACCSSDYGGDTPGADAGRFLGGRYGLVCWLDELFGSLPGWGPRWRACKLELALYGTDEGAWAYWDQARLALARDSHDALEVYFLCVMLGFRGIQRTEPARLRTWVAEARMLLNRSHDNPWPDPPMLEPRADARPLAARERLHKLVLAGALAFLIAIPVTVFLAVRQLGF